LNATLPGISKHTVDQRLRLATTHIGAGSKFGAARCFYAVEAEGRNQQLAFRDPLLFRANYVDANDAKIDEQDCNKGELAAKADLKLQDIQSPYRSAMKQNSRRCYRFRFHRTCRQRRQSA
jgi:hypothetical protein